jgi:hypothetical protein
MPGRFNEQPDAAQLGQLSGQTPGVVGGFEAGDPVHGGGERDAVAGLSGFDRQSDRQMCLSGSGWPEQDDIAGLGQECAGAQVGDHVPVQCWLMIEVEVLQ